ncbi:MAG: ABC transporter substrate-binding protein [bacterium]|nr:ABC transporter substrate-binding protein [bacterium]
MNDQAINSSAVPHSVTPAIPVNEPPKGSTSKIIILATICILIGLSLGGIFGLVLKNNKAQEKTGITPAATNDAKPFLIGEVIPLTGDGASYGVPVKQASLVIEREINKQGGIGGRPVKFLFEDGRCSSQDAAIAGEKLINEVGVDLIHGGECSDEFLAVAPISQKKKIIAVTASATSPEVSTLGKYVFRAIPSDSFAGKVAAQYATNKMTAKTAAVIGENTNYANALTKIFKAEFEALGGKVVIMESYDTGATKFTDFVAAANKQKVDVVYMVPQTPTPGVLIVKALKDTGSTAKMLTAEVLLTRDEIPKQGKILDDVVGIETYFDENNPKGKHIINLYKAEYGKDNTYPTDLVAIYDLVYMYKEAYESVGSNDTDKISEYLYNLKDWDGAAGKITFDRNGDVTSLPYAIQRIKDKKVSLIETYTVK